MQIQVHTGHNIASHQELIDKVSEIVNNTLTRFSGHITRVDVHLSDENSNKKIGHDVMRCMIKVHIEGRQPVAVTQKATGLDEAVEGASNKIAGMIWTILGRMQNRERLEDAPETDESNTEAREQSSAIPL